MGFNSGFKGLTVLDKKRPPYCQSKCHAYLGSEVKKPQIFQRKMKITIHFLNKIL